MESKHTPTPWKRSEENAYSILTPQGGLIAKTSYHWVDPVSARLNAAFIVKACNNFEQLVKVARRALDVIEEAEAMEWEKGGAETIPQAEDLRRILEAIKQA